MKNSKPSILEQLDALLADGKSWEESTGVTIINNVGAPKPANSKMKMTVTAVVIILGALVEGARRLELFK